MSQVGVADVVGLGRQKVSDFLCSKAAKQLLGEGYKRLFTRIGGIAEKNEAAIEVLRQSVEASNQRAEEDRNESRAFRGEMQSMVSRLDALVNYLMKQS
ncbi:MAG: hypothetical protein F6K04_19700 [Leptolyngbya sp. SIO4C5]|nr:hypothetical protein [Leptolyngbya sp. SIO4C5]